MINLIKKIMGDKKEYKEQMARVDALPEDYKFVFEKMQAYMWSFAGGDGCDMLKIQSELIDLFEDSAANGRHVLDVTGENVAGFCHELIRDTKKWSDKYSDKLNRSITYKIRKYKEK